MASKAKLGRADALALARRVEEVIAVKGKKVTRILLKDKPSDDELAAVLLGPTGNLRAPTAHIGKKLVVGFSPEIYDELF